MQLINRKGKTKNNLEALVKKIHNRMEDVASSQTREKRRLKCKRKCSNVERKGVQQIKRKDLLNNFVGKENSKPYGRCSVQQNSRKKE